MRSKLIITAGAALSLLLTACSPTISNSGSAPVTRGSNYPKMYEETPMTILIMPPINNTVDVDAKEYFYTTMAMPLCDKGYYVISPFLAMELMRSESAYDSELFLESDLKIFNTVFNADVALFTVINTWSKSGISGEVSVNIDYIMRSTKTNEVLFQRNGEVVIDTSVSSGTGGLLGLVVDLAATAINTAMTEKISAARECNTFILSDLPEGNYSNNYLKDKEQDAKEINYKGIIKK